MQRGPNPRTANRCWKCYVSESLTKMILAPIPLSKALAKLSLSLGPAFGFKGEKCSNALPGQRCPGVGFDRFREMCPKGAAYLRVTRTKSKPKLPHLQRTVVRPARSVTRALIGGEGHSLLKCTWRSIIFVSRPLGRQRKDATALTAAKPSRYRTQARHATVSRLETLARPSLPLPTSRPQLVFGSWRRRTDRSEWRAAETPRIHRYMFTH